MATLSHREITDMFGMKATGDQRVFRRVSGFAGADAEAIVFAQDESSYGEARRSAAGLIFAPVSCVAEGDGRVFAVENPKYAFAVCGHALEEVTASAIHASAVIEEGAVIGQGTLVGAGAVIEAGVLIGELCRIGPNVTICRGTTIGDRVVVQAGTVLGGSGFGYVREPDGRHVRFPQVGTLRIENDVEIGALCTIDRGALGETSIGRGTKIDNLVHIAHNCRVGEDVLIAAQVGMAGSCVIEDGAMLGGQVGLGERVTIGRGVILGGQGGVMPGKRLDGPGEVFWGTPAQPVRDYLRDVARMRKGR